MEELAVLIGAIIAIGVAVIVGAYYLLRESHFDFVARIYPFQRHALAGRERHAHRVHAHDLTAGIAEVVDRFVLDDELRPGLARLRHGNHFTADDIHPGVARCPCRLIVPLPVRAAGRNYRAEHRNDSKSPLHTLLLHLRIHADFFHERPSYHRFPVPLQITLSKQPDYVN